jgi:hypothetical protein
MAAKAKKKASRRSWEIGWGVPRITRKRKAAKKKNKTNSKAMRKCSLDPTNPNGSRAHSGLWNWNQLGMKRLNNCGTANR